MEGDVFEKLYRLMRRAGGEESRAGGLRLRLGTVRAADPLQVDVGGTAQEAARFYIAQRLLRGFRERVTLSGGTGGFTANGGTHSVSLVAGTLLVSDTELATAEPVLRAGDRVLLLTEDDQTFYLLDKVVHL
ncbi:DUF2577 family protein [uncultured Oscillibacter sp.]|uniref:DUF2577 family protein n=1 Tax=uncultured Oscillibacter sp. TaxID=876091 RepID=UPI0025EC77C5|nr:DUF2577 family protein [uncultured Oscillibacter sp.]